MSNPAAARFLELLHRLQANRFRDLAGSRVSAMIPVPEALANELIASAVPPTAPVRSVAIRPEADDRFGLRIVPKVALIPAITLQLGIEEQPRLPGSAVVTLRMVTLGGLFGLASGAIAGMLPPGVRLDGDRIHIDLRAIAAQRGADGVFDYLTTLQIHSEPGRLVLHVDALVDAR